jgi:hypothetical protein
MSKVVCVTAGSIEFRRPGAVRGIESSARLAAIRHIMLRVLPKPMSSASRPPRKSGGASSVLYPLTLFLYLLLRVIH